MTPEQAVERLSALIAVIESEGLHVSGGSECCGCSSAQVTVFRGPHFGEDYEEAVLWL